MEKPGILANLGRLLLGGMLALPGLVLYFLASWEGIGASFFFSLLFALGARWALLGLVGFVRPLPARKITYGAALAGAILMSLAGPSISQSYQKRQEPIAWLKASESDEVIVWKKQYLEPIPEPFRRSEWKSRYAQVRCQEALTRNDYSTMREVAAEVFGDTSKVYDQQVRESVQKAYQDLFAKGLASIKPSRLADPKMSTAFKKALEALASNPTRKMVLSFESKGGVGPMAADKSAMMDLPPEYAKLPILAVGEAFGPSAKSRRASTTRIAIQGGLNAVIPPDLAAIELATDKSNPEDVQFLIDADIRRLPGFYINSSNDVPESFLYKVEVHWKFRILVDNKSLGEFTFRSEPAKSVNYSVDPGDPEWAPYSIMMDSASDNFARLVVGRLGLEPPPEITNYTFTPNDSAPPAQPAPATSPTP